MSLLRNLRLTLLAALLFMNCVVLTSARAQEQSSPKQPERTAAQDSQNEPPTIGQELAHETREAAGEEKDETAEFKQSASVRLIAKWTGMSLQHAYWLSVLLNFVAIAALIVWAGQKYLPGMFRDRTASIQKALQEAQKASEEARARLADIESRLKKLDSEIAAMRVAAEKEAAAEEARIRAAAEEDAQKIIQSAEQEIAAAIKSARRDLTAYAADLAVGLAQKQIHLDAATDQAIVRNFVAELGTAQNGAGKDRQ